MKHLLFILLLYATLCNTYAQKYDLIVINKGGSIACKVDSVSSSAVFSRMKYRDAWVHTHANLNQIASVEYDVVGKGEYVFQQGSTYLKKPVSEKDTQAYYQANSIVAESNVLAMSSIEYSRIVRVEGMNLLLRGGYIMGTGFGYGDHWIKFGFSLLSFGPRHFFETGALLIYGVGCESSPAFLFAYRCLSKFGLTFTVNSYLLLNIDPAFMPTAGLGYSF